MRPLLVFGHDRLAECLRVADAGIEHAVLECVKMLAMRAHLAELAPLGPTELVFRGLTDEGLGFDVVRAVRERGALPVAAAGPVHAGRVKRAQPGKAARFPGRQGYTRGSPFPSTAGFSVQENRRFPRLDHSYAGELGLSMGGDERITLPVLVTSVSPHGASVSLQNPAHLPAKGSLVTLRFWYNREAFVLPARVAWARENPQNAELGLELLLDLTPEDMSQRYARWIVEAFTSQKEE